MLFETLNQSAQRGELMLVDGGMCHWHLRQDGQLTIREIIATRRGAGSQMLNRLKLTPGATSLFAKCPANLPANDWYSRRGFHVERRETTATGRELIHWRLSTAYKIRAPNLGPIELIYCAAGNRRFAEIAIDHGFLYGAQLPATVYFRPYFVDQDWRNPKREAYIETIRQYRPYMATVLDWERSNQLSDVLEWAEAIAPYVQEIVIIPKVPGEVHRIPRRVAGRPVRLGYSVPTRYAGTTVPLYEFAEWPVHLLGGSPQKQMEIAQYLHVRSADTNYHTKMALSNGHFWVNGTAWYARDPFWPRINETGVIIDGDLPYEAFRRSCNQIKRAWMKAIHRPKCPVPPGQLTLPGMIR
jgi:hypothetical protein